MTVKHHAGAYEVVFTSLAEAVDSIPNDSIWITDSNVERLYASRLPSGTRIISVPPGEASKSIDCWRDLQSGLATMGAGRHTTVVAFGGGVVGDLAGFVAAAFMRGVALVQVPTTLLSQVDSSVGGKVGVDLPEGKNLVGAFYPPRQVLICIEVLDTLDTRQLANGMAEVWKAGFILDAELVGQLLAGNLDRNEIVSRCINLKREIVELDEFETTGDRAKLNFGHTVGHAIEKLTGYGPILHGEAISIGMVSEAALGEAIGLTQKGTRIVVEDCLRSQGLPTTSVVLRNVDMLIETMRRDKKASEGRLAFSLLTGIGECRLVDDISEADVRAVLADL